MAMGGSLEQARRMGRWQAASNVQRYTKLHWLVRNRSRLPERVLQDGQAFLENPEKAVIKAIKSGVGADTDLGNVLVRALMVTRTQMLTTDGSVDMSEGAKLDETGEFNKQGAKMIGKSKKGRARRLA